MDLMCKQTELDAVVQARAQIGALASQLGLSFDHAVDTDDYELVRALQVVSNRQAAARNPAPPKPEPSPSPAHQPAAEGPQTVQARTWLLQVNAARAQQPARAPSSGALSPAENEELAWAVVNRLRAQRGLVPVHEGGR